MRQKRKLLPWVLFLAVVLLVGWKIRPVELVSDRLLLDLDAVIADADWGEEGNPGDVQKEPVEEGQDPDSGNTAEPEKPEGDEEKEIIVTVQGEKITLDGIVVKDAVVLKKYLLRKLGGDVAVYLEDNYAEAHVYKAVFEVLVAVQEQEQFKLGEVVK